MGSAAIEEGVVVDAAETWTLGASAVREWVRTAMAGQEKVYACEYTLSRFSEGAATVRLLGAQGVVALVQVRRPGLPTLYTMRRRCGEGAREPRGERLRRPLDEPMRRLLKVLRDCARRGAVCPRNRVLAVRAQLKGPLAASYTIKKLVAAGRISVRLDRRTGARVVTLLDSNAQTAEVLA